MTVAASPEALGEEDGGTEIALAPACFCQALAAQFGAVVTGARRGSLPNDSCTGNRRFRYAGSGLLVTLAGVSFYLPSTPAHALVLRALHLRLISYLRTALRTFFAAVRVSDS